MNILFFLTPKSEVAYINDDDTLRQALEKMEHHKYAAVPIICLLYTSTTPRRIRSCSEISTILCSIPSAATARTPISF